MAFDPFTRTPGIAGEAYPGDGRMGKGEGQSAGCNLIRN